MVYIKEQKIFRIIVAALILVTAVISTFITTNQVRAFPPISPPNNLVVTETTNDCFDITWNKGTNSTTTVMVICKNIVQPCGNTDMGNLSSYCMMLYNGSGTSINGSCGWDLNNQEYTITAWGVDSGGNYSTGCVTITVGGDRMLSVIYWAIGVIVAIFFTALSFWQKKMWLFVLAGIFWWILGIFSMVYNDTYSLGWALGFVYLAIGLACMLATMWLHEKRDAPMESPQDQGFRETKERIKERKSKRNDY